MASYIGHAVSDNGDVVPRPGVIVDRVNMDIGHVRISICLFIGTVYKQ